MVMKALVRTWMDRAIRATVRKWMILPGDLPIEVSIPISKTVVSD